MRELPKVSLTEGARVGNGCEDAHVLDVCVDDVRMDCSTCEGAQGPNGSRPHYLFENIIKEKKKKDKKKSKKNNKKSKCWKNKGKRRGGNRARRKVA